MKREDLYNGITDIRDDLIDGAGKAEKGKRRRRWAAAAAVLAVAVGVGAALWGRDASHCSTERQDAVGCRAANYAVGIAAYPEMAPYPDESKYTNQLTGGYNSEAFSKDFDAWRDGRRAQLGRMPEDLENLTPFFADSARQFLDGGGENRVYSPLNVYMALSMLAELTEGDSRRQVLDLLGVDSIENLRAQANGLWNANYCDDGAVTSVLASSLWLNENINFVPETMETLAENYYASSFRGKMGDEAFSEALRDWLNTQTGGLLAEQAEGVELTPETVMALATTIYFRARWGSEFNPSQTAPQTFHAPSGDLECDFMHSGGTEAYFWGDRFAAVGKSLNESGYLWFLLPDEGVTPEALLEDEQALDFLLRLDRDKWEWENQKGLIVNLAVPKFDVSSDVDLTAGLKELGVTDVFDAGMSDFSPMTADTDVFLSEAEHAARVKIDEEGVTAAAYTMMLMTGAGMPPEEEVDFTLDRPFLFAITGESGLPLFLGVVNRP